MMGIFACRDLISKLAMFLLVTFKDFNLLIRSLEFLMCAKLIVPRREVKTFAMALLTCVARFTSVGIGINIA